MSAESSRAVWAMRLRLALLRHRVHVDADRMVFDAGYARGIVDECKLSGVPELAELARKFEQQWRREAGTVKAASARSPGPPVG
jgi:hypothetical protein